MYDPTESYVGPRWFPKIVRKWLSKHFNKPAYWHDVEYEQGGSRERIDANFYTRMVNESTTSMDLFRAKYRYWAVRWFGWLSKKPRWMTR